MLSKDVKYRRRLNRFRRQSRLSAAWFAQLLRKMRAELGYLPWEDTRVTHWRMEPREPTEEDKLRPDYIPGHTFLQIKVWRSDPRPT